jgi:phosphoribosylanthranilate isomerase
MVMVKICGVRTVEAARAIAEAGAELAGINFVPESRRYVAPESAAPIVENLGAAIAVGVFADRSAAEIDRIASSLRIEWIQLHGRESASVTAELCRKYRVIKAFVLDASFTKEQLEPHLRWADYFLFDAARPGSGVPFDWSLLPESPRPFLLAGGLTPENVAAAIAKTAPFGVDTASGVETDGVQDPTKIRAFISAAKAF